MAKGREIDGLLSRQHVYATTFILLHLVGLMIYLGLKYKNDQKAIDRILKISDFVMIGLYVAEVLDSFFVRIIAGTIDLSTFKGQKWLLGTFINAMPLYLCDIAIWGIPIIAFTKGKPRLILSNFLAIWGIPMGVIGTYLAGNVFLNRPVFSFDGFLCIFIHVVPAALTVFLYITKTARLEKKSMWQTLICFVIFSAFVLVYDYIFFPNFETNFMFFFTGDGTPFDLFRPYVDLWVYQVIVFVLYFLYMFLFYIVYFAIEKKLKSKKVEIPINAA